MKPLLAIILAAGKGTRMKSTRAKVTFPIAGKPMVQRVVNTALAVDCQKIAVVIGYLKESVIACLEEDERLVFVEQTEQLGTGHAVMCTEDALKDVEGDVLILCGDVPLLSKDTLDHLVSTHRETGAACTLLTAFLDDPGKYGRVLRDSDGMVSGIVEYKDATPAQRDIKEWNTGIYCFQIRDMFQALSLISNQNQQGEYYLTDTLAILRSQGKAIASIPLERHIEVSGVNSQQQLAELEDAFIASIREHWLNNGVMMHNPASIYIDDEVIIEADVEIGPHCVIKGKTTLETGVVVGPSCLIDTCRICNDCILEGHNLLSYAHIPEQHILTYGEQVIEEESYE